MKILEQNLPSLPLKPFKAAAKGPRSRGYIADTRTFSISFLSSNADMLTLNFGAGKEAQGRFTIETLWQDNFQSQVYISRILTSVKVFISDTSGPICFGHPQFDPGNPDRVPLLPTPSRPL